MGRLTSEPSKWFKIIRTIGVVLAAISGGILASPIALPAGIVTAAGYIALGGSIAAGVAHTANQEE